MQRSRYENRAEKVIRCNTVIRLKSPEAMTIWLIIIHLLYLGMGSKLAMSLEMLPNSLLLKLIQWL